jgi:hypothetical protein
MKDYSNAKQSNVTVTPDRESVNLLSAGNRLNSSSDKYLKRIKNREISEETGRILACIAMLDDLYGCVADALDFMYGSCQVDGIINEDYHPKHTGIENFLFKCLNESISEKVKNKTSNKI